MTQIRERVHGSFYCIGRLQVTSQSRKKWAWPTDFVWQKSMEVYGKPLTTATSVVAKLPSVRLVL